MAEVVGTAYVRIRAITTQLGKDISDAVEKGGADADAERIGRESIGEPLVEGAGHAIRADLPGEIDQSVDSATQDVDTDRRGRFRNLGKSMMTSIRNGMKDEEGSFRRGLTQSLKNIGETVSKNLKLAPIAWMGMLAVPALGGAINLISAYLIGAIAQVGFLATAAVGAGAAIAGGIGAAIPAIGVLIAAFQAESDELEQFKERMDDLGERWQRLGRLAQRGLLPALDQAATILTNRLLPVMDEYAKDIGTIAGNTAILAAESLTAAENQDDLQRIFRGSKDIFRDVKRVVVAFSKALIPFLDAAVPLAADLSEIFADWAERFSRFIRRSHETGELSTTLETWWDRAKKFGGALKNIWDALWNVLEIGGDVAEPFFDTLARLAPTVGTVHGKHQGPETDQGRV